MKRNIKTKITSVSRNRVLHKYFLILNLTFRSNLINNSLYNSLISSAVSKRFFLFLLQTEFRNFVYFGGVIFEDRFIKNTIKVYL